MKTEEERSFKFELREVCPRIFGALIFAFALLLTASTGSAFTVYQEGDWNIRWDNTLKYSVSFRVSDQDSKLIDDPQTDDGDRNFDTGVVSNRADILSELDIRYRKCGIRVSGAGWYDTIYNDDNDNDSPLTFNGRGDNDEFSGDTERLHGRTIELLDAFFFARGTVGDLPYVFRAGRHTLLWGETLFFGANGVAGAQAPVDLIKGLSVPGIQFKELLMPVGQFTGQIQLTPTFSLAAFWQFEWRRSRIPGSGSYFSDIDVMDAGGEKLLVAPVPLPAFFRGDDMGAGRSTSEFGETDWGQFGISATLRSDKLDTDFGFHYVRYHAKNTYWLYLDPTKVNMAIGKIGEYSLVFPKDIDMLAVSFGTQFGPANVSGEVSYRMDTPLISSPQISLPWLNAGNDSNPLYAIGDTFHANLSTTYIMTMGRWWDGGSLLAEVGVDYLDSVNKNKAALDPDRDSTAYGFRMLFEPAYYQVWPGWDFRVPIGFGYSPMGKSSVDLKFNNGGGDKGGDVSVGVNVTYLDVWRFGAKYVNYFGGATYNVLKDRDFISLTLERTF